MKIRLEHLLGTRFGDVLQDLSAPIHVNLLWIGGMEITQAIQYFDAERHLTDARDRGADNSIPLVMHKPAWVRVYLHSLLFAGVQVHGRLRLRRGRGWRPIFDDVGTFEPQWPGTATVQDRDYVAERGTLGSTLNFVIPAAEMSGRLQLTVEVWLDGGDSAAPADSHTTTVDVILHQTLNLRGVMVRYDGPNAAGTADLSLAAPTLADLTATAAWSLTTMPVASRGNFSSAGTISWGTPLTGMALAPGGCSRQWLDLNAAVADARVLDGNRQNTIYYGLLPVGIPIANVGGCESDGVGSGRSGDGVTMAHEIGHACALQHGPCNVPGDARYPAYEPYDRSGIATASLGEYGLDINNGAIRTPARKDLMSYCGGDWFSLYHYGRLLGNARLNPRWETGLRVPELVDPYLWPWEYLPDPPPDPLTDWRLVATQPLISVIAVVGLDRHVDVRSVRRVETIARIDGGRPTALALQLIGQDGAPVGETPLLRMPSNGGCGCGCGCKEDDGEGDDDPGGAFLVQALLPDTEPGTALRIVVREAPGEPLEIWSRQAPDRPPEIGSFEVDLDESGGRARWDVQGGDALDYALQFSKDDGKSWNALAVGLHEPRHEFDAEPLPSGELIFRLHVGDGFHTTTAVSRPLRLRERPPIVVILHPAPTAVLRAGAPMRLWASVDPRDGSDVEPGLCRWTLDDREAGTGPDVFVTAPEPGGHRCRITVESQDGSIEAEASFETRD